MNLVLEALAVLAGGAVAATLLARWGRVALAIGLLAVIAAGAMVSVAAMDALGGGAGAVQRMVLDWPMPLGRAELAVDALSGWFLLIIGVLSLSVAIYSWGYVQRAGGAFGALMCLLVGAMVLTVCAHDAVLFLVGWELMSIAAFFLIGLDNENPRAQGAAWMYLVSTHLGTAAGVFPLLAILISRAGGATGFDSFESLLWSSSPGFCVGVFALGVIGFGTKAGFMPMHVWLPVAHPEAPSPVSALMSGVVIKTGIYGLLRLICWLPPLPVGCGVALIAIGGIGGVLGILYALSQKQIKRMLAYSSVENIGIIGMGIGIGLLGRSLKVPVVAQLGFAGALLHVLNHAMFKGLLFMSAGTVLHGTGTGNIERLGGLAKKTPGNAVMFVIGAMAICALPPFNGLVSEWLVYGAMFRMAGTGTGFAAAGVAGLTMLALIGGLALAAFAKVIGVVFLGEARDASIHAHRTHPAMILGMAILAAGCLGVGLVPWMAGSVVAEVLGTLRLGAGNSVTLGAAMEPLTQMAVVSGVLLLLVAGLLVIRGLAGLRNPVVKREATWGCGYAYASARVQYTGSSFGATLVQSFRQPLRAKVRVQRPAGYFPVGGQLETEAPDVALTKGFGPIFERVERWCLALRPLQRGMVQLYLVYIGVALMGVFAVEAVWRPYGDVGSGFGVQGSVQKSDGGNEMKREGVAGPSPLPSPRGGERELLREKGVGHE